MRLRGISRRLRSLKEWSMSLDGFFPNTLGESEEYWNMKIPVISTLVDGRFSSKEIRVECAQCLIDATHAIFRSKPQSKDKFRVTCSITIPQVFASEICIFSSEGYYKEHTTPGVGRFGKISLITCRSICEDWGLKLPGGFHELGVLREDADEDGNSLIYECWYLGEVK